MRIPMEQNVKCRQAEVTRKTGETDIIRSV